MEGVMMGFAFPSARNVARSSTVSLRLTPSALASKEK
jgi:hypothetical protein